MPGGTALLSTNGMSVNPARTLLRAQLHDFPFRHEGPVVFVLQYRNRVAAERV